MTCPKCDSKTEVVKSVVGATAVDRLRSCPKHGRFWSVERLLRWVAGFTGNPPATASQPPANPPATHGQPAGNNSVVGDLGGSQSSLSLSVMNPAPSEPPDQTPARVEPRKRKPTDPAIGERAQRLVAIFCEEWKARRGSGYTPTQRDAGACKQLAKTWTDMDRWRVVTRAYLGKPTFGNRQPALWEIAGSPNGHDTPGIAGGKTAANLSVISDWMDEQQKGAQ